MDILEFRYFNPCGKEPWADLFKTAHAVEIYINGNELSNIVEEIEHPQAETAGDPELACPYGHRAPSYLYRDLAEAQKPGTYCSNSGVELLCCDACGFPGCWSVVAKIEEDESLVYWKNFTTITENGNMTFVTALTKNST